MKRWIGVALGLAVVGGGVWLVREGQAKPDDPMKMEQAKLTFAPEVPPALSRKAPAVVRVNLETSEVKGTMMEGWEKGEGVQYIYWTFNGRVPGPFIRVRLGDVLELALTNPKTSTMDHNIDLHAVTGPGGGAKATTAKPGETKVARFKMLNPGLYVYHCAAPPVPTHIANGMYGLILVEPEEGLPAVDKEFYVMQGDFYTKGAYGDEGLQDFDEKKLMEEHPTYVLFNGKVNALMGEGALKAKTGERIRIYFGNGGPNLTSSFHVIGEIFDRLFNLAAMSAPQTHVQTTTVPQGGAAIADFTAEVPGAYTLVDHAIIRIDKGAIGQLIVEGKDRPDLYGVVSK